MPSRFTVAKPDIVNVTRYVPGLSWTIWYRPDASVIAERVFSINAGLDAWTVTPGSTAPELSLTVPVMALVCACATPGATARNANAAKAAANRLREAGIDALA